jgi:hypothetical protein
MLLGRPNLLTSACKSNHAPEQANHDFASEIQPNSSIDPAGFLHHIGNGHSKNPNSRSWVWPATDVRLGAANRPRRAWWARHVAGLSLHSYQIVTQESPLLYAGLG